MRIRVILFCLLLVVAMMSLRVLMERTAERNRQHRPWGNEYQVADGAINTDRPPWIQNTPPPRPPYPQDSDSRRRSPPPGLPIDTPTTLPGDPASSPENEALGDDVLDEDPLEAFLAEEATRLAEEDSTPAEDEGTTEGSSLEEAGGETPPVVINEIMFHPAPENGREPLAHEYIELYNPGSQAIALEGHQFTRGVDFTFPAVTLPAGGYLVVAADVEAFRTAYRTQAPVVGGWTGRLSNSGEEIRLEDAEGKLVNKVEYADQGDWARRVLSNRVSMSHRSSFSGRSTFSRGGNPGWLWQCEADGEGASLELITTALSNNHGANWLPSTSGPTPGAANSVAATNIAPLISDVEHRPAVPRPNERVLILAKIEAERPGAVQAQVYWRVSERRGRTPFQSTPMKALSSGRYAAVLPAHADKTVIEFYVKAGDGQAVRNWPAGPDEESRANALYQVDSETNRNSMAFYRLIMTEEENRRFGSNRHSNAQSNTTLIADDGSGPVIRYLCGTRVRGAGSRNNSPPPMRVNLPRDRPWRGATRMNLNSLYPWLQYIGMKLFQASGLPAPNALPVQVRRNGEDTMRRDYRDYGLFVHLQPLDGDFIDQHISGDDGGNLYKKVRPDSNWRWRAGAVDGYQNDGWLKQTNKSENDWTDLDQFLQIMNTAPRESDYLEQVGRVMDIDQWLRYLAVMALLANGEGGIANGIDDDYAIYRGLEDQRFKALPHDLDTILGVGEGTSNPQHTLFDFVDRHNTLEPLEPLFAQRQIRERYFSIMGELVQTSFSPPQFESLLNQHLSAWVPASTIERMQDFMALRTAYATREIERYLGRRLEPKEAPSSPVSHEAMMGNPVMINEILAYNVSAHSHQGEFPDVIELFNAGKETVSLAGMSLTDRADKPGKYIFPEDASIGPEGYLLVYADDRTAEGEYHTGFSLKREGETLHFFGPQSDGKRALIDRVAFGPQLADYSIGRGGKDNAIWALTDPTLGAANVSVSVGEVKEVRINEWLAGHEAHFANDFIELGNMSDRPVSLGGITLTTNYVETPEEHRFPALSYIGARDFLLLGSRGKRQARRHPCDLPFRLPSHHGWIRLIGANGTEVDKVHYVCQRPDIAQGRLPDGSAAIVHLTLPTPGGANAARGEISQEVGALLRGLRVSEIMYHPVDGDLEFIELTNIHSEPLALAGVRFTNGIEYVFGEDDILEPEGCLVLVSDRKAFAAHVDEGIRIAGEYSGKLSNGGEVIELSLPSPEEMAIQRFEYNDKWYQETDGGGASLTIVNLRANVKEWGNLTNWRPSKATGGSPGTF